VYDAGFNSYIAALLLEHRYNHPCAMVFWQLLVHKLELDRVCHRLRRIIAAGQYRAQVHLLAEAWPQGSISKAWPELVANALLAVGGLYAPSTRWQLAAATALAWERRRRRRVRNRWRLALFLLDNPSVRCSRRQLPTPAWETNPELLAAKLATVDDDGGSWHHARASPQLLQYASRIAEIHAAEEDSRKAREQEALARRSLAAHVDEQAAAEQEREEAQRLHGSIETVLNRAIVRAQHEAELSKQEAVRLHEQHELALKQIEQLHQTLVEERAAKSHARMLAAGQSAWIGGLRFLSAARDGALRAAAEQNRQQHLTEHEEKRAALATERDALAAERNALAAQLTAMAEAHAAEVALLRSQVGKHTSTGTGILGPEAVPLPPMSAPVHIPPTIPAGEFPLQPPQQRVSSACDSRATYASPFEA